MLVDGEDYIIRLRRFLNYSINEDDYKYFESCTHLLKIPAKEEDKLRKAKFFRPTGPEYADFEKKYIYFNQDEVKHILTGLKEHRIVLLKGMAASGKTSLSRFLAFEKYKKGMHCQFFKIDSEFGKSNLAIIEKQIEYFGKESPNNLLIIEDAHLNSKFVNYLLNKKHRFLSEILITTREIHGIPKNENNLFDSLKTIPIKPTKDLIDEIIKKYVEKKLPNFKKKLEEVTASINDIYNENHWEDSVNLWLLAYALKAIESKKINVI